MAISICYLWDGDFNAVPSEPVYEVFKCSSSPQLTSAYCTCAAGSGHAGTRVHAPPIIH